MTFMKRGVSACTHGPLEDWVAYSARPHQLMHTAAGTVESCVTSLCLVQHTYGVLFFDVVYSWDTRKQHCFVTVQETSKTELQSFTGV